MENGLEGSKIKLGMISLPGGKGMKRKIPDAEVRDMDMGAG